MLGYSPGGTPCGTKVQQRFLSLTSTTRLQDSTTSGMSARAASSNFGPHNKMSPWASITLHCVIFLMLTYYWNVGQQGLVLAQHWGDGALAPRSLVPAVYLYLCSCSCLAGLPINYRHPQHTLCGKGVLLFLYHGGGAQLAGFAP